MARTKTTAKKTPLVDAEAEPSTPKKDASIASTSETHMNARKRRVSQGANILWQIRQAQDKTCHCIPRASMIRLVRDISQQSMPECRWYDTALSCIQEAAEDYIIEYFNDTCILAANAHRVTVMDRDMASLGMLRKRYENFMYQSNVRDKKMRDILLISPVNPRPGITIEEIKPEDIHDKNTRLNEEKKEALKARQRTQSQSSDQDIKLDLLGRENQVLIKLDGINSDLRIDCTDGDIHILTAGSLDMLKRFNVDLSDNMILTCL